MPIVFSHGPDGGLDPADAIVDALGIASFEIKPSKSSGPVIPSNLPMVASRLQALEESLIGLNVKALKESLIDLKATNDQFRMAFVVRQQVFC